MKKNLLLFALCTGMAFSSCNTTPQEDYAWVKKGVETATAQLKWTGDEVKESGQLPRSIRTGYDMEFLCQQLERDSLTFKDSLRAKAAPEEMGKRRLCGVYDWTSGFFPGTLWYTYELSGDKAVKALAMDYTNLLNPVRYYTGTPCFRGAAFTAPQEGETEFHTQLNRIVSVGEKETELDLYTAKNPNTVTPAMQGVILELEMPKEGKLTADFNGKQFEHTLGELLEGSRSPARPAMGVELADLGGEGITFKKKE